MNDVEQINGLVAQKVAFYGIRDRRYRNNLNAYLGNYHEIDDENTIDGTDRKLKDPTTQVWNLQQPIVNTSVLQMARLPEIVVPSEKMADRKKAVFAENQEKILYAWWDRNGMVHKHARMAFQLATFGTTVTMVRPSEDKDMPVVQVRNPGHCYPQEKGEGERELSWCAFRWFDDPASIKGRWPEATLGIEPRPGMDNLMEVVEWLDETDYVILVEGKQVHSHRHELGYVPVAITPAVDMGELFGPSDIDQLVAINIYLNSLMTKMADALEENLYPLTFMRGGNERLINTGPGAVNWIDADTEPVRLDPAHIPSELFHQVEYVEEFMRTAAIWPRVMSGQSDSSITTGKALSRLQGSASGMAALRQQYLGADLQRVNEWGMRMLEKLWKNKEFIWRGASPISAISAPSRETGFTIKFVPSQDINGHYDNFLYYSIFGADIAASTNSGLQLLGGGIISKRFLRNQLPGIRDAEGMREEIKEEKREEMEFEIELQQKLIQMQTEAAMAQQSQAAALQAEAQGQAAGPEGAPPEGGPPPAAQGGGGLPPGVGGPSTLPGSQPFAMGMGEPLSGEENFPLPFEEVKPYKQALNTLSPPGGEPPGRVREDNSIDGAVKFEEVEGALQGVEKIRGDVYLMGKIAQRGETQGAIEVGLTVMNDKQTIINALRPNGWTFEFIRVDPGRPPQGARLVVSAEEKEQTAQNEPTAGPVEELEPQAQEV